MSIIQDIRDKYAKVTVVLVALALLGFILTDYFAGKSRMGGQMESSVGSVNGTLWLFKPKRI
jgi:peptidyl-prolyl cis-trans isomerase D